MNGLNIDPVDDMVNELRQRVFKLEQQIAQMQPAIDYVKELAAWIEKVREGALELQKQLNQK